MSITRMLATLLALAALALPARAEVSELKIAEQYGIGYLPLTIMKANKLVEKHLKQAGLAETKVVWSVLASGQPMNDALLSGNLDIAAGGVGPLLTIWAPAKTPDAVLKRLNQETVRLLQKADVKDKLIKNGQEALGSTPEQLAALPQQCLRSDRRSSYEQWDLPLQDALARETELGRAVIASGETAAGAARFAAGAGRHGRELRR